jgi:transposase
MRSVGQSRVEALAQLAVQKTAPDELALFPVAATAYFDDPQRAVKAAKANARDDVLGIGVELADAMPMISTAALWVAHQVVTWIGSEVRASLEEETGGVIRSWVRRVLRRLGMGTDEEKGSDVAESLSPEQLARVRQVAVERALEVLPEKEARAVADAVVAGLVLPATEG